MSKNLPLWNHFIKFKFILFNKKIGQINGLTSDKAQWCSPVNHFGLSSFWRPPKTRVQISTVVVVGWNSRLGHCFPLSKGDFKWLSSCSSDMIGNEHVWFSHIYSVWVETFVFPSKMGQLGNPAFGFHL